VDAASIEVSRRLRHVKTDRLDGDRLLAKLIRHHAGERGGWSVVRVPRVENEEARIEGGDERIVLALTSEPGQPSPELLIGTKMNNAS
jgi:hypothetical protein